MSEPVEVKLGADTGDVKVQFDQTANAVAQSLNRMADALKGFTDQTKRNADETKKHNDDLAKSFKDLNSKMSGSLEGLTGIVGKVKGAIAGLSTVLAGGMLYKEAITATLEFKESVEQLERVLGMDSKRATEFAIALKLAGTNANDFSTMTLHVGRMLKNQSDEFDRLKVKVRDATGAFLPMDQILRNVYERMQEFKAGTDQNLFALSLVGRGAKDFAETMERLAEAEKRAAQMAHDLGIEMGPEQQAKVKAYRLEYNAFTTTLDMIGVKIGIETMPRLQQMAAWMNEEGPRAAGAIVTAIKGIAIALTYLDGVAREAGVAIAHKFEVEGIVLEGFRRHVEAMSRLDWQGAKQNAKAWTDQVKDAQGNFRASIDEERKKTLDALEKLFNPIATGGGAGAPGKIGGKESFIPKPTGGGGAEQSVMSALEAQLKVIRDTFEREKLEQGSFEQWSETQTRDYWARIKDYAQLSEKDRLAVLDRYYDAERRVRQQAFQGEIAGLYASLENFKYDYDERVRIAQEAYAKIATAYGVSSAQAQEAARKVAEQENAKAQAALRLAEIKERMADATAQHEFQMGKLTMDQDLAMRRITADQAFDIERNLENRLYALRKDAAERALAEAQKLGDTNKIEEMNARKEALEMAHQERLTQIANDAERERMANSLQATAAVEGAFARFLSDLATGAKSVKDAFRSMVNSIVQAISQIAAANIAKALFGPGTAAGGFLTSFFGQFGSTLGGVFGGGLAGLFGGGGGGGFNPIDPFGFAGIPSFAVGTPYVPKDMVALIHQGEAIVPAEFNKSGRHGGGVTVSNHFAITGPVDRRTQDQIAVATQRAVMRATYRNA